MINSVTGGLAGSKQQERCQVFPIQDCAFRIFSSGKKSQTIDVSKILQQIVAW